MDNLSCWDHINIKVVPKLENFHSGEGGGVGVKFIMYFFSLCDHNEARGMG